ncbi:MAG: HD domain-containing protein [Gammaproteobacteria bacterium]|nr:HD domain-containing protein [Gammaproteobacteria bacterium]
MNQSDTLKTMSGNINDNILEVLLLSLQRSIPKLALHSKRIACIASEIAKQLGYDSDFQKKLLVAGLLHDIGCLKIGVDLEQMPISMAQGEQLAAYEQHTIESENFILPLVEDKIILQAVRNHHERMDGKGFPDQLSGQEIPISARILAVADYYDTLLAGEIFGEHRSKPTQAKKHLIEAKEKILDPDVTDALLTILEKPPVLFLPSEDNPLKLYTLVHLEIGELKIGDLVNQDGNFILKQGTQITQAIMDKIDNEYLGQKVLTPRAVETKTEDS